MKKKKKKHEPPTLFLVLGVVPNFISKNINPYQQKFFFVPRKRNSAPNLHTFRALTQLGNFAAFCCIHELKRLNPRSGCWQSMVWWFLIFFVRYTTHQTKISSSDFFFLSVFVLFYFGFFFLFLGNEGNKNLFMVVFTQKNKSKRWALRMKSKRLKQEKNYIFFFECLSDRTCCVSEQQDLGVKTPFFII